MSFSDLLHPRPEVLSDEGIEGIIDLANLDDPRGRKLEANPDLFLQLTYPTADIRRIIQNLHERFEGSGAIPGLFLLEGLKGSGKSHLLLLIYHLFNNPHPANTWLANHGLVCSLPSDVTPVINKFTDLPLSSIWEFIFEKLTGHPPEKSVVQPSLAQVQEVLGQQRLVLIFDELEQGIRVIPDPAMKAQNIAFLQMLSEWANRSDQVTLFAAIYSDQQEPGATLKRVPACRIHFGHAEDRARIVLHRLFKNYLNFDPQAAASIVDSYMNLWSRSVALNGDQYRSRFLATYPFLPELLDLILTRVPARGGFQNVRGALGFLANLVRLSQAAKADVITAAHATLCDREVAVRLADLDTSGDLIRQAKANLNELGDQSLADEIAAVVMLYTLTGSGRTVGVSREELLKHILQPVVDINEFEKTLLAFQKYASHFHYQEGRYFFDPEENADAKVEYKSLLVDAMKAREQLRQLWRDQLFREPNAVVYTDVERTQEAVETREKGRLRYILAPRRLLPEERHGLYYGLSARNEIILLEPRDARFDLDQNSDLLKWSKRQLAAQSLIGRTPDSQRRAEYEHIAREDRKHCLDTIKRAGLVFIRWEHYGRTAAEDRVEEEVLTGASKDDVQRALSQQYFPVQLFEEHLSPRLAELKGRSIKEIDQQYRATLGFPVPTTVRSVSAAIRSLCQAGHIGIRHPRGNFCGEDPQLTETELSVATLDEPFEKGVPQKASPQTQSSAEYAKTRAAKPQTPERISEGATAAGGAQVEEIMILPQPGSGALRQEVAARLQSFADAKIIKARFIVYLSEETGDLSSLPASLRGGLSGPGSITAEITLTKAGEFSKGQLEQLIEALPIVPKADYSARLDVVVEGAAEPVKTDD